MGASAEDAVPTFRAPAANPVRGSVITKCGNSPEGIRSDNFSEREPFVQELVHLDSRHVGPTPWDEADSLPDARPYGLLQDILTASPQ